MSDDEREFIDKWRIKALNDLKAAQILIKAENCPTDTVIYHCQQAVEKYMKMILSMNEIPFRKTHDLEMLFSLIVENKPAISIISDEILQLNSYGTGIRYPDNFYIPTFDEAVKIVSVAEKLIDSLGSHFAQQ
jgi:HEPN domain-containing protein